jgi:hypothetical protein
MDKITIDLNDSFDLATRIIEDQQKKKTDGCIPTAYMWFQEKLKEQNDGIRKPST